MSALYTMRYSGQGGQGFGVVYFGRGTILGVDEDGDRYTGSYSEQDGRMKVEIVLHMPKGGPIVTGKQMPPGTTISMTAIWPSNFADGQPRQIELPGGTVSVIYEKVGDIP
jgi:hypothetical protein